MGVYLTFYRVTPEQLAAAEAHPSAVGELCTESNDWDTLDGAATNLSNDWEGLTWLIEHAGVDVDLLNGFFLSDGGPLDDEGHYQTWTVDDVAEAARHLRATPFERLARVFDPALMSQQLRGAYDAGAAGDYLDYAEEEYEVLVRFFDEAAKAGDAAIRWFG
jgi:hypothetical protein